jgi:hypothetical protein
MTRVSKLVVDLGWSLWTELGVPGVVRRHPHVAIDPEPLIVFSPWLFRDDARLQEEVVRWCVAHADRISASRLHGLVKTASPDVSSALHELTMTLHAHGVPWTKAGAKTTQPTPTPTTTTTTKPLALPTTRPALIRMRLRALAGVGARADVLAELLGHQGRWLIASDLHHLGYSKRNVARVLGELADAGIADARADKNAVGFKLATPLLGQLLQGQRLTWPPWAALLAFVEDAQRLRDDQGKSEVVRRVAAPKAAARFDAACAALDLKRSVASAADPWSAVVVWAEEQLSAIVDGTSPVLALPAKEQTNTRRDERSKRNP